MNLPKVQKKSIFFPHNSIIVKTRYKSIFSTCLPGYLFQLNLFWHCFLILDYLTCPISLPYSSSPTMQPNKHGNTYQDKQMKKLLKIGLYKVKPLTCRAESLSSHNDLSLSRSHITSVKICFSDIKESFKPSNSSCIFSCSFFFSCKSSDN